MNDDDELDIEQEKLRRKQKIERRGDSSDEVGPKDGYFSINWQSSAQFIWGNDLKLDNIVYFRKKVLAATSAVIASTFDFKVTSATNNLLNTDVTCDGLSKSPGVTWS